ncbi:hypothetical protein BDY19DRAFT_904702 [Irpex rosettiformis]|uniref:Uncharacterized protein n=1 Tax=Irpex rosettiformis TaxID=378272 RepID=A0ACB8UAH6_9APHY|nr:hypothetical protein BDY19DRAFT_904702 [Irpex rosettiformis]
MMNQALEFAASVVLLQLLPEFKLLAIALTGRSPHGRIPALPLVLSSLKGFCNAYYTACIKCIIVSVTIVNSVLRALGKQSSTMSVTLTGPRCTPMSWGAGVMSIFCGLASITLSFWYANQFRLVVLSDRSLFIWIQNARRNAASPWKNVFSLLAAPSVLCIWSVILYTIHLVTSTNQCQASPGPTSDFNDVLLPARLPWVHISIGTNVIKAIVAVFAFLLWTYMVHAMRAFAELNDPTPR